MTDEEDTQPTRPARMRRPTTQGDHQERCACGHRRGLHTGAGATRTARGTVLDDGGCIGEIDADGRGRGCSCDQFQARCTAVGMTGDCDAPADLRCPTCGRALCFACAAEHTGYGAPSCGDRAR